MATLPTAEANQYEHAESIASCYSKFHKPHKTKGKQKVIKGTHTIAARPDQLVISSCAGL
jgi:hypothetical protein